MYIFGHLIGAWVVGLIIQKFRKKKLSRLAWGLLLLGSIMPDFDFFFDWVLGMEVHRTFSHSLLFALAMFLLIYFLLKRMKMEKDAMFLSFGILTHLLLDFPFIPGVPLFWPLETWFSINGLAYSNLLPEMTIESLKYGWNKLLMDSMLGLIWISYLYLKKDLRFS